MEEVVKFEFSKDFLEKFSEAVAAKDKSFIKESLEGINHVDVSELLNELDSEDSKYVLDLIDPEIGARILVDLESDTRAKFLKIFGSKEIAFYLNHLDSDDAVDILNETPIKQREEVILYLEDEEKTQYILDLLRYEEDSAGGLMAKELIKVNINWTVKQCIEEIRRQAENVDKVYTMYVVDNEDVLLGRVSLKRILLEPDNSFISDIYTEDIVSIETYLDEEEVASIMQKYDLDAVPVVNVKGKLVGRITIDDIVDVITEQAEEERQIMSGITEDVEASDTIWLLSRARLPWLIIGMAGGLLGAYFIGMFEEDLVLIPAMAFFIPLITATGGNVGIQSSSIVVQSLANKSNFGEGTSEQLFKILTVAVINGLVLAGLVLGINLLLGQEIQLSLVVSTALFSVVLLASFMGTVTPIILDKIGINPAIASGPFITTTNDLLGLAVYFIVAHLLFNA